jgi:hypothetical protein
VSGLILTTRGWTGAAVVFVHASGSETYTVTGDTLNPHDVAAALAAWVDDAARVWSASISNVTMTAGTNTARVTYTLAYTGTFSSITPNATWTARMGATATAAVAVPCSCSGEWDTSTWDRWDTSPGVRAREGSFRAGSPHTAMRRPSAQAGLTLAQAYALADAKRGPLVQPRTAYVYDERRLTWRWVTLGDLRVAHPEGDATIVVATADMLGAE